MELIQVSNFLNGRYLLSNYKADKTAILKGTLLASYSLDFLGNSKNEKIYYDTNNFFFAEKGINIYIVATAQDRELVIRYDSEQVTRIEFLKNIPNFFKLKIAKNDSIHKYHAEIIEAIYKVFPSGLNVNIEEILSTCVPQVRILKKRESYRVVNNSGLKMTISFDNTKYFGLTTRSKFEQPTLDVVGDAYRDRDDFKTFLKYIIRDYPKLIKIDSNELTVARKGL